MNFLHHLTIQLIRNVEEISNSKKLLHLLLIKKVFQLFSQKLWTRSTRTRNHKWWRIINKKSKINSSEKNNLYALKKILKHMKKRKIYIMKKNISKINVKSLFSFLKNFQCFQFHSKLWLWNMKLCTDVCGKVSCCSQIF